MKSESGFSLAIDSQPLEKLQPPKPIIFPFTEWPNSIFCNQKQMYNPSARAGESIWWSWHIRSSAVAMWPCASRQGTLPSLRSLSSDLQDQPPTVPHKSWNTKHSVARCDWQVPLSMGFTRNWSQSWGWLPFSVFIAWTFWGFYQVM